VLRDHRGQTSRARRLVIATGMSHPYLPPIPGIELAERYVDMSVDPAEFAGQRVLILGKGNSAFETANHLVETTARIHLVSPSSVQMAWTTHHAGNLRAINNHYLDTYQLKAQNAALDATVERIERRDGEYAVTMTYAHASGETEELCYDRVLVCTGFRLDDAIFDASCRPELTMNDRHPRLTSAWESTTVPDLYFAGVLMSSRDVKKASSPFIHGFRYNVRTLHRIFNSRYHGEPFPSRVVAAEPGAFSIALLERINRTSALWQQFGFLCDLFVLTPDGASAHRYEELPLDFVADSGLISKNTHYLTLTLEYGPRQPNPFAVVRDPRPEGAAASTFLHPILRHYQGEKLVGEHHVLENLLGEWWDESLHRGPLQAFLAGTSGTA
jgi:thioredoxin reductase